MKSLSPTPKTHRVSWVDNGRVGVECDGMEIYMGLDQCNARSPKSCRRCGAKLRLHYEVWIEEEA